MRNAGSLTQWTVFPSRRTENGRNSVVWIHHNGQEEYAHYSEVRPRVVINHKVPSTLQVVADNFDADVSMTGRAGEVP